MRAWCSFLHRQTHPYRRFRVSNVQNASAVLIFCIPKRTPIEEFAPWTIKMRAWCSFLHRKTHPYRGFCSWNVQNANVVLIFASPNAPLSQISPFGRPKCERGANFCIAKRTLQDFAFRTSKTRVQCPRWYSQTHPCRRFRFWDI